jgi:hypothetical protein
MSPREASANAAARRQARDARLLRKETRRALKRAKKSQLKGEVLMVDWNIQPPPLTGWVAPAAQPEPIDWAHRENLRMWRVLAAQGHEAGQAVVAYHNLAPLPAPALAPAPVPASATISATVPRLPRATVPAAPQPATPVLSGLQGRVDMLTRLISPPVPPGFD